MVRYGSLIGLMVLSFPLVASAQNKSAQNKSAQSKPDQTALPRVLILGDSIYQQPASDIRKALKGKAEVVYPRMDPGNVLSTALAMKDFDKLIGDKKWDVIHFNFGLGDLIYRAAGMKTFRVMPPGSGGVRTSDRQSYEQNLKQLVVRLKATQAKLIWASTTPIRHSASKVFDKGSEIQYNTIAAKVMSENDIPINDMYEHVKSLIDMDRPASHGFDPFFFDRKPIHQPVLEAIEQNLPRSN